MVILWKYLIFALFPAAMLITSCEASRAKDDKRLDVEGEGFARTNRRKNTHQRQLKSRQHQELESHGGPILSSKNPGDVRHSKYTRTFSEKYGKSIAALNTKTSCCENGGQCVLGSFCVCPKEFFGRYCQYELKKADCGSIPHLGWAKQGCDLCYCYDGRSTCLSKVFDNCGNTTSHTREESPKQTPFFQPSANFRDDYPYLTSSNDADDEAEDYYSDDEAYSTCDDARNVLSRSSLCLFFSCVYISVQFIVL